MRFLDKHANNERWVLLLVVSIETGIVCNLDLPAQQRRLKKPCPAVGMAGRGRSALHIGPNPPTLLPIRSSCFAGIKRGSGDLGVTPPHPIAGTWTTQFQTAQPVPRAVGALCVCVSRRRPLVCTCNLPVLGRPRQN